MKGTKITPVVVLTDISSEPKRKTKKAVGIQPSSSSRVGTPTLSKALKMTAQTNKRVWKPPPVAQKRNATTYKMTVTKHPKPNTSANSADAEIDRSIKRAASVLASLKITETFLQQQRKRQNS